MRLDTPIRDYLPDFDVPSIFGPGATSDDITLRQLLGHTSGLPRSSPCALSSPTPACNLTLPQALQRLSQLGLLQPPGHGPQYSNLGFSLAGHTLAHVTGTPWLQALPNDVLQPLGMSHSFTSYAAIPTALRSDVAVGFSYVGTPATPLDDGWESPAGSVFASADDLVRFLGFIFEALRGDQATNTTAASARVADANDNNSSSVLLSPAGVRDWIKPHVWNSDGISGFGLPWELFAGYGPQQQYTFYTKSGGMRGYLSKLGFVPELRSGYILLQSDFSDGFDPANKLLQDFVTGPLEAALMAQAAAKGQPAPPLPADVEALVGRYRLVDPYVIPLPKTYTVSLVPSGVPGGWQLQLQGWSDPPPYLVWDPHHSLRDFFIGVNPSAPFNATCDSNQQGVPGPLHFVRDATTGRVTGLEFPGLYYGSTFTRLP